MMNIFTRTEALIGRDAIEKLSKSHVAIFGIGGVGGSCVEALVRAGIGRITIVDHDTVNKSNINRQIIATSKTVGQAKVNVMKARISSINPSCEVTAIKEFFLPEKADSFDFSGYDYVVDAIDTVAAKISIIEQAKKSDCRIISAMGTGNKLHPEMFEIEDVSKTCVCPLARVIRRELSKRGIEGVKCVYSKEVPVKNDRVPASISFVPPVAGLVMAGEVIRNLIG